MSKKSASLLGAAGCLTAACIWGFAFVVVKSSLDPVKEFCVFRLEEVASVSYLYGSASTCKSLFLIPFRFYTALLLTIFSLLRFPRCS